MVSFFFTPIYMFILVFVVSFGTKKGTLLSYASAWVSLFTTSFALVTNLAVRPDFTFTKKRLARLYRFQHTALTSRLTTYILTSFWVFFFFFGETLLLFVFNYNTLTDLIQSGFFTFTKSHFIFATQSGNASLGDVVFFFILFFTTSAAAFLLNLKYTFTYSYNKNSTLLDITVCLLITYLLVSYGSLLAFALVLALVKLLRSTSS